MVTKDHGFRRTLAQECGMVVDYDPFRSCIVISVFFDCLRGIWVRMGRLDGGSLVCVACSSTGSGLATQTGLAISGYRQQDTSDGSWPCASGASTLRHLWAQRRNTAWPNRADRALCSDCNGLRTNLGVQCP